MLKTSLSKTERALIIVIPGDIVSTSVRQLSAEITDCMTEGRTQPGQWDHLEMDLTSARMVDSAGLNFLVTLVKTLQKEGKQLRLRTGNSHILRSLHFTRLDQLIQVMS